MSRRNLGLVISELDCFARSPKESATIGWDGFVSEKTKKGLQELKEQARVVRVKAEQRLLIKNLVEREKILEESDYND